ncbi:hypothetical protein SAMN05216456_2878 [Devosia crocina]|uniref:Uncharacterized protein n=1 Tax=Devosia crocina TaxID=429728 RepID=A0A1I7NRW3_9HYPH|nr:hypothetical protein [Devosia crocina]SFV37355.1 hypothetical protein SAMN05216456_2878 [Devosia crocina]
MASRTRAYVWEVGSAVAVLAIYLLVLLAPLHQAAGLQRQLLALGYVSTDTASVCAALARDQNERSAVKCAAAGIGKNETAVDPVVLSLEFRRVATLVSYLARQTPGSAALERSQGQPRAPPVSV